jgi:lupus La protein
VLFQVEFYFSDSNLYRDNFLHDKVKANSDGFVDIPLLCTFSRMQTLLADASGDNKIPDSAAADVAAILKESTSLVVSEDGKQVRRAEVRDLPAFISKIPRRSP